MFRNKILILFIILTASFFSIAAAETPPEPASPQTRADLSDAFFQRIEGDGGSSLLTFDLFHPELDSAFLSPDGKTAVLWLALRDDTGRILSTEPGFAVAALTADGWQVMLPGDPGWEETLAALPEGMLPVELSPAPDSVEITAVTEALTGYYLPYAAGTSRWLEGSISHFQSFPARGYPSCGYDYCHYAYDFTDQGHFPLLASKGGYVYASRDTCIDGDSYCTNYIVLKNSGEEIYQIYLHLSNGTIPDKLTPDTAVVRGQYLGDTDDTGYSTSNHVHFMVTNSIWLPQDRIDQYYWGYSVDIRFADVAINNGIPRTCYEVTHFPIYDGATECLGDKANPLDPDNDWFPSGNAGAFPAGGSISRPAPGAVVTLGNNPLMDVTVNATDDVHVEAVSLVAKINNQWVEIGPRVTQPASGSLYDWDIDLCAVGPVNGPLEVALRIWDHEGNVSSALDPRTIQVDYACPLPSSALKPPETFDSTAVHLSWDASVTPRGFGIASFELQWRTEPGVWQSANTLTFPANARSTWFVGQLGSTYGFRLRAIDIFGQPEPWPTAGAAEITTVMPVSCTPDPHEPDDDRSQARTVTLGEWTGGNLCGPGDPDWFQVQFDQEHNYAILASSKGGAAALRVTVYAQDGTTVVASAVSPGFGQGTGLRLPSPAPGTYYARVEPFDPKLAGTGAEYGFVIFESRDVYLPIVAR